MHLSEYNKIVDLKRNGALNLGRIILLGTRQ
ncbi:unknown [Alistipes sp. CAG:435]|nr:unknown [Alistipes sp. CAG:435]